jgi:glycosyltransferase involved in cell wall biosynthesis
MIIGIDASRANLEHKTGVEFYSYFLIQEFKKLITPPHRVILYSREPLVDDLADLPPNWESKIIKTPVYIPLKGKKPFLWTQLGLSLEMLRRPPDILFVPSHALPLIHPKNSIVTIHDLGFLRFPESYHPLARVYHRFAAKFAVRRAQKIIAISQFTKDELVNLYSADSAKIEVVPLGYDAGRFHPNLDEEKRKQAVLEKYGVVHIRRSDLRIYGGRTSVSTPYLFYVGRLEKKKNLVALIKAFEQLMITIMSRPGHYGNDFRKLNLLLAGGRAFGFDEIRRAIVSSPVRNQIKILDYVASEDLPYLMSSANVFVFPSLYEGFGIPVLEAQAVGTPVVASDIPALREVAGEIEPEARVASAAEARPREIERLGTGNSSVLFANPHDPQDFAKKIKTILEDEALRQALISRGLEQIKKYSWQETARKTLDILWPDYVIRREARSGGANDAGRNQERT